MTFQNPKLIAHRGASQIAPENTLSAFNKAAELGAKWIEFDVTLSKDGEAVIFHDLNLNRTSNGLGRLCDHDHRDLKLLSAGKWFHESFAQEIIPHFRDVLTIMREKSLSAVIEIKPAPGFEVATAKTVATILKNEFPEMISHCVISSFSHLALQEARKEIPNANLALGIDNLNIPWREINNELHLQSLHVCFSLLTPELIDEIKQSGLAIFSYTINLQALADALFEMGVDAIFTDQIGQLKEK